MMYKNDPSDMEKSQTSWFSYTNVLAFAFIILIVLLIIFLIFYDQVISQASNQNPTPYRPGSSLGERQRDLESKLEAEIDRLTEIDENLRNLTNIRANIINELNVSFTDSDLVLDIDNKTGAIRFSEGIFFGSDRHDIRSNGLEYLNKFIPIYMSILLSEENSIYLSEIIIEGHSDDVGGYIYNLDLSQRRAFAVARFILEDNITGFPHKDIVHEYLTATGRSFSHPIEVNGKIDKDQSRRVEFKFRLKDEEIINEMLKLFEGVN